MDEVSMDESQELVSMSHSRRWVWWLIGGIAVAAVAIPLVLKYQAEARKTFWDRLWERF